MKLLKRVLTHELVSGSFYLFIGSMVANVLAFLLNLFLARNLSYADYGIFASLLSLITLAYIPAGSINTVIVKFATNFYSKNEYIRLNTFYRYSFKIILSISLGFFLVFLALAFPLNSFLHLNNIWYGISVALIVSVFYLYTLNLAFLQSLMKFATISVLNTLSGVIKLLMGMLLVLLGFKAFSGLWSIFFMTFGFFIIAFYPLRKIIFGKTGKKIEIPTSEIKKYSVPAFFTVLFFTFFTSADVIWVKHFFSESSAGFYAGLSLIGRVIFYFTFPIPLVFFPLLVKRHAIGQSYKKLFYLALLLVLIPSIAITGTYFLIPEFIINLFLGGRDYLILASYLGIFGIYLSLFSLVNVFVNFFLSFNEIRISYFVIPAALLHSLLLFLFHKDFYQVIFISISVLSSLLIVLGLYYFKKYKL